MGRVQAQDFSVLYGEGAYSEQQLRSEVVQSPQMANTMLTFDDRYKGIEGNPYFLNNWTSGRVVSKNGDIFEHFKLGLNLEANWLQAIDPNRRLRILDKTMIQSFTLYDSTTSKEHRFEKIPVEGERQYCQVIYQGENVLYNLMVKRFVKADIGGGYNTGENFDKYVTDEWYYVSLNGTYPEIKNNRKSVLKVFSDKAAALKAYIKSEQIFFEDIEDLVKVVKYYDGL